MSDSKIQIKIGIVEFSGEGNSDWLGSQLDKILEKIPELLKIELASPSNNEGSNNNGIASKNGTSGVKPSNLPTFLRDKGATSNQVKKFLTTAAFMQLNGKDRMTTSEVSALLSKNNQSKLNNPSDKLAQNVGKGHISKEGNTFFVTPEGFAELSIEV